MPMFKWNLQVQRSAFVVDLSENDGEVSFLFASDKPKESKVWPIDFLFDMLRCSFWGLYANPRRFHALIELIITLTTARVMWRIVHIAAALWLNLVVPPMEIFIANEVSMLKVRILFLQVIINKKKCTFVVLFEPDLKLCSSVFHGDAHSVTANESVVHYLWPLPLIMLHALKDPIEVSIDILKKAIIWLQAFGHDIVLHHSLFTCKHDPITVSYLIVVALEKNIVSLFQDTLLTEIRFSHSPILLNPF